MCATWVPQIIGAVPEIQHGESRVTTEGVYSPNVAMSIIILIIVSHVELKDKTLFTVQLTVFISYLNFNQFLTNFQPNESYNFLGKQQVHYEEFQLHLSEFRMVKQHKFLKFCWKPLFSTLHAMLP